ncbi:MAG TPA: restriction endonuclease [Rhodospirillales bacterium]|nr:restriction endonuclease [Rhodospirillales bacterium]
MAIPDYQTLMLPVLRLAAQGEITTKDLTAQLADEFSLSEGERTERLKSGQGVFRNRVSWALVYLSIAGLLERTGRGKYRITEDGRKALSLNPDRIDNRFLKRFPKYRNWREGRTDRAEPDPSDRENVVETPEERIDAAFKEYSAALERELLEKLRDISPEAFERLIIDLMAAMGYGQRGTHRHLGRSGDGGVDGLITEDALGLDKVYLQAKRYAAGNAVGRPQVQQFLGALDEHGAAKGVFVTTSRFTLDARRAEARTGRQLVLVDGEELARLMVRYRVGVRRLRRYDLERIDEDYFEQLAD